MKKEKINLTENQLRDLWNGVYYKGRPYELKGEIYEQVDTVNTSDYSDGPSWDYIIQRKSDNKFFKFNVWDAGDHNGYIFGDKYIKEVFPKTITMYE